MANDTREDHGSYYPGGRIIVSGSGTSGTTTDVSGKVDRVSIEEIGDLYTLKIVKEKVDRLIRVVAPVAPMIAAMLLVTQVRAATEVLEDIPANARVVVSEDDPVALAAIPGAVGSATNAAVAAAKAYADAAVAVEASDRADAVSNVFTLSQRYADSATNALTAKIPVIDLTPYAQKTWVESKGYVTAAALDGVATKAWVGDQGYLTVLSLTPYATMDWVLGKGYATPSVTNGLASRAWVSQSIIDESRSADRRNDAKFATKDDLDVLKRMYADTNGVTRLWSEDGRTMMDGTGVVWDVTWNVVTNWTSLSNGVVFVQAFSQMEGVKWVSQGIYTNALGQSSSATIQVAAGVLSIYLDAHSGSAGTFEVSAGQTLVEAHEYGYNDTFSNSTVRVPAFEFRSRVVTNAVGHAAGEWLAVENPSAKGKFSLYSDSVYNGGIEVDVGERPFLVSEPAVLFSMAGYDVDDRWFHSTNYQWFARIEISGTQDGYGMGYLRELGVSNLVSYSTGNIYDYDDNGNLKTMSRYDLGPTYGILAHGLFDIRASTWMSESGELMKRVEFHADNTYDREGVGVENMFDLGDNAYLKIGSGYDVGGEHHGWGRIEVSGYDVVAEILKRPSAENVTNVVKGTLAGQTFDFADNRVLYTALSNIIIRLGGTVTNFPDFQ